MSLRSSRPLVSPLTAVLIAALIGASAVLAPTGAGAAGPAAGGGEPGAPEDFTPPTIAVDYPSGGVDGWFGDTVHVQVRLSDVAAPGQYASGVDPGASYAQLTGADTRRIPLSQLDTTITLAAEGSTKVDVHAQDREGNQSHSEFYVGVDRSAPTFALDGPFRPDAYLRAGAEVAAQYSCWDIDSGVAECSGDVAPGGLVPTDTPGRHTVTLRAVDRVGNVRVWPITYLVRTEMDVVTPTTVTGTPRIGELLTGTEPVFTPEPVRVERFWQRDGEPLPHTRGLTTYRLTEDDEGTDVSYVVEAHLEGDFYVSKSSAATVRVESRSGIRLIRSARIDGVPRVGERLVGRPAELHPAPPHLRHVWYRDDRVIPGATEELYTLVAADAGRAIRYETQASLDGTVWKKASSPVLRIEGDPIPDPQPDPQPGPQSAPQAGPQAGPLVAQGVVRVGGVARVGQVLSATPPGFTGMPAGASATLAYQWLREGRPIAGATGASYRLAVADAGRRMSVRVTASHPGLSPVTVTSAVSAAVAKAAPKVKATVKAAGAGRLRLTTTVAAAGVPKASVTGKVVVRRGKVVVARGTVKAGRAVLTLKRQPRGTGTTVYRIAFRGSPALAAASATARVSGRGPCPDAAATFAAEGGPRAQPNVQATSTWPAARTKPSLPLAARMGSLPSMFWV